MGLKLANNSRNGEIAYGVVAGVVGLVYIVLAVFRRKGDGRVVRVRKEAEVQERRREGSNVSGSGSGSGSGRRFMVFK